MEQCEGCHTYSLIQKIKENVFSYCSIARLIEVKELSKCPCTNCIVKCMCNNPCSEYNKIVNKKPNKIRG